MARQIWILITIVYGFFKFFRYFEELRILKFKVPLNCVLLKFKIAKVRPKINVLLKN